MADMTRHCDVAIVGAGPAGLSAAIELGTLGVDTLVLDEKPEAGGQLFKQIHRFFGSERHFAGMRGFDIGRHFLARCNELRIPILLECPVWGLYPGPIIGAVHKDATLLVHAKQVILATGAAENALAFPGWTLPGVMGAGAAQTLVNYHRVRPGRRAVVVGAGNVGLIVAYQLLQAGIEVAAIVESAPHLGGYLVHGAKLRRQGIPIHTGHTILEATGESRVQACTLARLDEQGKPIPDSARRLAADMICLAVGLSPAVELCAAIGLPMTWIPELGGQVPLHGPRLRTIPGGPLIAGDLSGVEEASTAMEEGRQAAVSAAAALGVLSAKQAEARSRTIQQALEDLRQGPFGRAIGHAKTSLYREHAAQCR